MRSFLFLPANRADMFAKACQSGADALILDLEDSVALKEKVAAREVVQQCLQTAKQNSQRWFVRINAFDTEFFMGDLAAVMPFSPDGIVLPKVNGQADIERLDHYLHAFEAAHGLTAGQTQVVGIATETPQAVLNLNSFTQQAPERLYGLMWGAEDLAGCLGATRNKVQGQYTSPFMLARNLCLMAAHAAGVNAIDTICAEIRDLDLLENEAQMAKEHGFTSKAVIHPSHIEVANRVFTPTEEEIEWAQKIIDAFVKNPELGVVNIDGQMIDKPHERIARTILSRAR